MSIEVTHSTAPELPVGHSAPPADAASSSAAEAPAAGEGAAAAAADSPGEQRTKARTYVDDVRRSIVERHRQHRQASIDPSLAAARAESTRSAALPGAEINGEAGSAGASGGSGGMGGREGAPVSPPASDEPRKVRVKVYGEEYDVPASAVEAAGGVENFQKAAAADYMLRRASDAAKRAERAAQEAEARVQQRATIPAAARASSDPSGLPTGDTGDASTALRDESRELLDAMLDSNPDRIAKVLGKVVSKAAQDGAMPAPAQPTSSAPAAPAGRVTRSDAEIATANAVFDNEYKHIRQDPEAMEIARDMVRARMADPRYDGTPLPELARQIGQQLAAKVAPSQRPGSTRQDPNLDATLALREAAKRQMPMVRTGQALSANPQPSKPEPSREQKQQSYVAMLRARSGSNATIAERRASTQR